MRNGRNGHKTNTNELQPHNAEAEEALLGALLIDPDAIVKIIDRQIAASDFHIIRLGWIYEAILDLFRGGKPTDLVTISDELERRSQAVEAGAPAILSKLINATPSSLHVEHYAEIVKRLSVQRQLIRASGDIAKLAYNGGEIETDDLLQSASNVLLNVSTGNQSHEPQTVNHYCQQVLDRLENIKDHNAGITGIPTGIADLDKILKGLQDGHLILVAGRPGMGKSSLAIQMARYAAQHHQAHSLIFSLEMLGDELTGRMVSAESNIDSQRMKSGPLNDSDYEALVSASVRVSQLPIRIDDRSRTIEEVRAKAIINKSKHGLDLLIVDYVQRVQAGGRYQNRDSEIGAISAALKNLALDLDIPIVAVASLSRKCEERANKRPILSDLRESGNLEYDADEVLFLYRDDIYDPEQKPVAEISVAKHRGGALGIVNTFFRKETTTFLPLTVRTTTFEQVN